MIELEKRYPAPLTKSDVKEIIREALEEWPNVGAEIHTEHHEWVSLRIEKERAARDVYISIAKSVAQWSVLGILGFIWAWLTHHIKAF